jgi:hypothetical protein
MALSMMELLEIGSENAISAGMRSPHKEAVGSHMENRGQINSKVSTTY